MSFFKHLLRGWMGGGYAGHHGKRRHGYHGGFADSGNAYGSPQAQGQCCARCGTNNAAGARFCAQCGSPLQGAPCAACGKDMLPGAKFCPGCGQSVRKTPP